MKAKSKEDLFDSRAVKRDGCWSWNGYKNRSGYGIIRPGGRTGKLFLAHRLSWVIYRGPIPDGMHVLHKCDNPECTNPDHLFLGTNIDNIKDRMEKGRPGAQHWLGCTEDHPRAELTDVDVIVIRARRENGATLGELSEHYAISKTNICGICKGRLRRATSLSLE